MNTTLLSFQQRTVLAHPETWAKARC